MIFKLILLSVILMAAAFAMIAIKMFFIKGAIFTKTCSSDIETKEGTSLGCTCEKNPGYVTPYLTLAKIYNSQGKIDKAIDLYKTLIEKRPDQASPHSLIGTLYEKQLKFDLAENHYKKALEINPDYIPAVNNLAFLYAQQNKELNTALDLARQAKERVGKLPAIMDTLGWVYYKKKLYDNAVTEFETCVDKKPENPIFYYHLGLTYNKLGEYVKAETALKKALELQKDFKGSSEAKKVLSQL